MTIRNQQIQLGSSSCAHILQQAQPACFVFLGTDTQCQHFLLAFQIDSQGRQNDAGITFFPMANCKMDAIELDYAPMGLQWAFAPRFKLLGERLVQTTDSTGDFLPLPSACEPLRPLYGCWFLPQTSGSTLQQLVARLDGTAQKPGCEIDPHGLLAR